MVDREDEGVRCRECGQYYRWPDEFEIDDDGNEVCDYCYEEWSLLGSEDAWEVVDEVKSGSM